MGGHALLQLGQEHLHPPALLGLPGAPAADGQVAGNAPQKGLQAGRPLGRHAVPRGVPRVADALLHVLPHGQQVPGDGAAVGAVLFVALHDGILIACVIQIHNQFVFHGRFPLSRQAATKCRLPSPTKSQKAEKSYEKIIFANAPAPWSAPAPAPAPRRPQGTPPPAPD